MSVAIASLVVESLVDVVNKCVMDAIRKCGDKYSFDAEEAIRELNLGEISFSSNSKSKSNVNKVAKVSKVKEVKEAKVSSAVPLPFSGEVLSENCQAVVQNNGLYTQWERE